MDETIEEAPVPLPGPAPRAARGRPSAAVVVVAAAVVLGSAVIAWSLATRDSASSSGAGGPGATSPGEGERDQEGEGAGSVPGEDAGEPPRPLGTIAPAEGADALCPAGTVCSSFTVECSRVSVPATVYMATGRPSGTPRGVVLFFSGGEGDSYWGGGAPVAEEWLADLQDEGFETIRARWPEGWTDTAAGDEAGMASTACRSATVVRWAYDNRFVPMGLEPAPGACGFCVTGNSAGSSQAAYTLAFYGLDTIVDAAILTGGPPHAAIAKGCLRRAEDEPFWYDSGNASGLDAAWGFARGEGPCARGDPAWVERWQADSVDLGGNDYVYPTTRVVFILGTKDQTVAPAHARDLLARLDASGTPWVEERTVTGLRHVIERSPDGLSELRDAVLTVP